MKKKITIGIADDHISYRQGIISLLKETTTALILFDVSNGSELLEALKTSQPDIILLDIEMPVMGGWEALIQIKIQHPYVKVIMLSSFYTKPYIVHFIREGASAFLPKEASIEKIIQAINDVYTVGIYYDEIVMEAMEGEFSQHMADINLTKREVEIMKLIQLDKTNNEIANILNVSTRTVEWHRLNLCKKIGLRTKEELILWAGQYL